MDVRVVRYQGPTDVKPWAIPARLVKAGLIKPTEGMRHARDAARHALYAAVHERITADPLSKRGLATGGPVEGVSLVSEVTA